MASRPKGCSPGRPKAPAGLDLEVLAAQAQLNRHQRYPNEGGNEGGGAGGATGVAWARAWEAREGGSVVVKRAAVDTSLGWRSYPRAMRGPRVHLARTATWYGAATHGP